MITRPASEASSGGAACLDGDRGPVAAEAAWETGRTAGRSATSSPSSPQVRAVSTRPVRSSNSSAVSLPA
ncbi:MAG TPA: hypothetical protein VFB06_09355 [Streptosporangiaceae bacterium]|nr:hypothetical protein [Streptosporangiaceae bacterium]